MYPLHPFSTHFPIALLLVSSLLTLVAARRGGEGWELSAYHCLLVGWLAGVIALLSGVFDAARQLFGPELPRTSTLIGLVNLHAISNLIAMTIYGQALLRRRRRPDLLADTRSRRAYLWLHAAGAAILLIGGWSGGYLVYVLGLGVQH